MYNVLERPQAEGGDKHVPAHILNTIRRLFALGVCASALSAIGACSAQPEGNEVTSRDVQEQKAEEPRNVSAPTEVEHAHTNRLVNETSPYLLQHAHNPVDWYPWGEEAFAAAREQDKPIFLSVGYSSCHWCHVMEREPFDNEEIAAVMNEHFVSIKVDREERPDVDEIYMTAVQAMTGSGGWPMSVFLTHDLNPFYGGTYFPPEDKYGRPGFKTLLTRIAATWNDRRGEVVQNADRLAEHMQDVLSSVVGESGVLTPELIAKAVQHLKISFDAQDGGFGPAPKFPPSPSIALLLREYQRTKDENVLNMATLTLDKMARGGMYDHLGGGFARYSTDDQWLVPHFEKMLYDNAQLSQVYLEAYQLTKDPLYRKVVQETFEYILSDMRDENGGFFSAEDADSEGEEGKFYIWTRDELTSHLGDKDGELFAAYYNVKRRGNFSSHEDYHKSKNILHTPHRAADIAKKFDLSEEELMSKIAALKKVLLEVRGRRVRPGLDDKILTSWNALMISSFAQGYQIFGDESYREAAEQAARFILTDMTRDGDLLRTHRKGVSRLPGYLDDYAFMIVALEDVYEATFNVEWLEAADGLTESMLEKFWDGERAGFYFTSEEHKNLIIRTRPTYDGAVPSGNAMAAYGLLRLSKFLDRPDYYDKARLMLESNHALMTQAPRGYLKMLCAVDYLLYPPKEIAIAGDRDSEGVKALLRVIQNEFLPNKILAYIDPAQENAKAIGKKVPLLAGKGLVDGLPAAYVCKDFACKLPVTTPEALSEQLGLRTGDV